MTLDTAREFLVWTTVISYGILLVWFAMFTLAKEWLRQLHGQWFDIPAQQFDVIHYAAMAAYKIGIMLFGLAPLVALYLID